MEDLTSAPDSEETKPVDLEAIVASLANAACFGPTFFASQLAPLVREHCPEPGEALPRVLLYLDRGDVLDVCHVIALAPRWVALAVFDHEERMSTEVVPYSAISRISMCTRPADGSARAIGFRQNHNPTLIGDTAP